jgi:hypothetical protein
MWNLYQTKQGCRKAIGVSEAQLSRWASPQPRVVRPTYAKPYILRLHQILMSDVTNV